MLLTDPPSCFYIHVHVNISHELMKHVIGKKGRWFDKISKDTSVNKIWFNKKRSIVEIWGPTTNLINAQYAIQSRINFIKNRFQEAITAASDDSENMEIMTTWPNDEYHEMPLFGEEVCLDPTHVKFLIGSDGVFFKFVTRKAGVSFVWYNCSNHSVQIWGQSEDILKAVEMIKDKIKTFKSV